MMKMLTSLFATQAVDSSTISITTRGTGDSQVVPVLAGLELRILSDKEEFEELSKELESDVLEGKSWAVKQTQAGEDFWMCQE
jgi:hypothetical protein